jgi:hypothetical protein
VVLEEARNCYKTSIESIENIVVVEQIVTDKYISIFIHWMSFLVAKQTIDQLHVSTVTNFFLHLNP